MRQPINWRRLGTAILIGGIGGAIFDYFGLPLAWMLGAMAFTTVASLIPIQIAVPGHIRSLFVAILGIMLGSAFTPDLVDQAARFAGTIALQAIFVAVVVSTGYFLYRVIGKYDHATAYFSSTPGGMTEMSLVGEAMGGDMRVIALNHAVRILIVVSVIPFYFRYIVGLDVPSQPQTGSIAGLDPTDAIILVVCGISGFLIGKKLSIPAYALIGPMVFSAAVHLAGFTTGNVPRELASVAQLVVGTAVGCRFVGITLGTMFRVSWLAAVNATLLILAAALTVSLVTRYFDTPPPILFLSLAPGGLAEMSLIALALGVDTAFVTVMHFMRLLLVMMLAPAAYRILGGRPPADTE